MPVPPDAVLLGSPDASSTLGEVDLSQSTSLRATSRQVALVRLANKAPAFFHTSGWAS
jgi:hypothetical protein